MGSTQTISYSATVTADASNLGLVYLNGDSMTVESPLVADDEPFIDNFPLYLGVGESATSILFDLTVPDGAPEGLYAGSFFVLGGEEDYDQDILASVDFNVEVQSHASPTPEPTTALLMAIGLIGLILAKGTFECR